MDMFILPGFVVGLCFSVLLLSFAVYLLSRHRLSVAARWLAAFCIVFVMTYEAWGIRTLVLPMQVSETLAFWVYSFGVGGLVPFTLALQQFIYAFRGNPYPREARILLLLTSSLALFILGLFIPLWMGHQRLMVVGGLISGAAFLGVVVVSLWTFVVAARKTVRFSRDAYTLTVDAGVSVEGSSSTWHHLLHPTGRAAHACRAFLGVMSLPFLLLFAAGMQWGVGLTAEIWASIWVTCTFLFLYGLIIAYVTYTPEPTTVQVKLVGTVLATVLLLLALISKVMYDDASLMQQAGATTPAPHTLHFAPNGQNGYTVMRNPFDPAQTPLQPQGERLPLGDDDEVAVPIGFLFPFYGAVWDSMYVSANGAIGLGAPVKGARSVNFVARDLLYDGPLVAPLFADFTPVSGGVFVDRTPEQVKITWHAVSMVGGDPDARYTMRATLHHSGAIDFRYATPPGQLLAARPAALAGRGLVPGEDKSPLQNLGLGQGDRMTGAPGTALVELFAEPVYGYGSSYGKKLLFLLIAVTLFCLLVLPFVFRASLLRPLARLLTGLQQVEKGQLDTAVNIPTHDEVGQLARHFNSMTHALRKAEYQLRDYAATLEEKVDARTAALTQSLEELKNAQARLVQAEKMASLGALTAGIAHEIKNPLNFVNNFAELSSELVEELRAELDALNGQLDVQHRAELEEILADLAINTQKINQHGRRADGIVQAMLLHSRGTEGERRAVDLNVLVEEYINLSYHGKRAQMPAFNATIEKNLDAAIGDIEIVPQDIGQVLLNLLDNAFDAVAEQAASASGPYAPKVRVSTQRMDGWIEIRIQDNGPGISEAMQAKIFEPFFTTKPTGSGTGLGLSLSYDIVTQGMVVASASRKGKALHSS